MTVADAFSTLFIQGTAMIAIIGLLVHVVIAMFYGR